MEAGRSPGLDPLGLDLERIKKELEGYTASFANKPQAPQIPQADISQIYQAAQNRINAAQQPVVPPPPPIGNLAPAPLEQPPMAPELGIPPAPPEMAQAPQGPIDPFTGQPTLTPGVVPPTALAGDMAQPPPQEPLPGFYQNLKESFLNSATYGNAGVFGETLKDLGEMANSPQVADWGQRLINYGATAPKIHEQLSISDLFDEESFAKNATDAKSYIAQQIGNGLGSTLLPIGAGLAATAAGLSLPVAAGATFLGASLPLAYGSVKQHIKAQLAEQGVQADPNLIKTGTLVTAIPIALLDLVGAKSIGAFGLAEARNTLIQGLAKSAVGKIAGAAATESGTEAVQQALEEGYTLLYDQNPRLAKRFLAVADAAVGGALVGGGVRTVEIPFEGSEAKAAPPGPPVIPGDLPVPPPDTAEVPPEEIEGGTPPEVPPGDGVSPPVVPPEGPTPPVPPVEPGEVTPPVAPPPEDVTPPTPPPPEEIPPVAPIDFGGKDPTVNITEDPSFKDEFERDDLYVVVQKGEQLEDKAQTRLMTPEETEAIVNTGTGDPKASFDIYRVRPDRVVPSRFSGSLTSYAMNWAAVTQHQDLMEAFDQLPGNAKNTFLQAVRGINEHGNIGDALSTTYALDQQLTAAGIKLPAIGGTLIYHGPVSALNPELVETHQTTEPSLVLDEKTGELVDVETGTDAKTKSVVTSIPRRLADRVKVPFEYYESLSDPASNLGKLLAASMHILPSNVSSAITSAIQQEDFQLAYDMLDKRNLIPRISSLDKRLGTSFTTPRSLVGAGYPTIKSSLAKIKYVQRMHKNNLLFGPDTTEANRTAPRAIHTYGKKVRFNTKQVGTSGTSIKGAQRSLVKLADSLMKSLMPGHYLLLTFDDDIAGNRGHYRGSGAHNEEYNEHQINIDPTLSPLRQLNAFIHEFGHLLSFSRISSMDSALLARAYHAWRGKAAAWAHSEGEEEFARSDIMFTSGYVRAKEYVNSWFNFWEWFATQYELAALQHGSFIEAIKAIKPLEATFEEMNAIVKNQHPNYNTPLEFKQFLKTDLLVRPTVPQAWATAKSNESKANFIAQRKDPGPRTNEFANSPAAMPAAAAKVQRMVARFHFGYKWLGDILQLAEANRHILPLQKYVQHIDNWHKKRMEWISRGDERIKQWRKAGKERAQKVNDLLFEVQKMEYLPPNSRTIRWPTQQELAAIANKIGVDLDGMKLYQNIVDDFRKILLDTKAVLERDARRAFPANSQELADRLDLINRQFKQMLAKPYFPHSRFGKYHVVTRMNGKTTYREAFENKGRADREAVRIQGLALPGESTSVETIPDEIVPFMGLPPMLLDKLESTLVLTPDQRKKFKDLIYEMSPAHSFKKHLMKKDNIGGYSTDGMRVYADYFFHAANHLARIEYSPLLTQDIKEMGDYTKSQLRPDEIVDVSKLNQIQQYLEWHKNDTLNPTREWHMLQGLAFLQFFGFDALSALVNLSQTPMVTFPRMSKIWGSGKTVVELTKAMANLKGMYNQGANLSLEENKALNKLIEIGSIDQSFAEDLAGLSSGNVLRNVVGGDIFERTWSEGVRWASFFFHTSEKLQRWGTGLATYRIAMKNPGKFKELYATQSEFISDLQTQGFSQAEAEAIATAKEIIRNTHFEHARWAKPRLMRGKKAGFFVFTNYMRNMLWILGKRPERLRTLAWVLAFSGLMGFPGAEDAEDLAKFIAGLFGQNIDPTGDAEKMLGHFMDNPDWILHGMARHSFGLSALGEATGFPFPDTDLSGRFSMGRILPFADALGKVTGPYGPKDATSLLGNLGASATGAAYNVVWIWLNALMHTNQPDSWRYYEQAMPRALRNLATAQRYYEEGAATSLSGEPISKFDLNDPMHLAEIAAQAIGAAPTRVRIDQEERRDVREKMAFIEGKRANLLEMYYEAFANKDKESRVEIRKEIGEFNKEYGKLDKSLRITQDTLMRSLKQRTKGDRLKDRFGETTQSRSRVRAALERNREAVGAY